MDEDRITLERFASELTGMHTMAVRVEHGDIVIDDGGDDEYVIRAIPYGGGLNIEAFLHVYCRANKTFTGVSSASEETYSGRTGSALNGGNNEQG
jgi:hypothetical protein